MGPIIDIMIGLLSAWRFGSRIVKNTIITSIIITVIAIIIGITGKFFPYYPYIQSITEGVAAALGVIAGVLALVITAYQKSNEETKREQRIEEAERRVQENPKETQAAWELARVKLESYLDRNLKQVRSIFWLTVFIMLVGFSLISFGIYNIYQDPKSLNASVLSTITGVLINFIGATFLILYKSTMAQAKDYVTVLERINAVGMSVQILDKIENDESNLRQKTTAEVAKQLLVLYTDPGKNT